MVKHKEKVISIYLNKIDQIKNFVKLSYTKG